MIEAFGLICTCLCSPEDQWSLSTKYAHLQSVISEIIDETTLYINTPWAHLLSWDDHSVITLAPLHKYVNAPNNFRVPTSSVSLFIDCTIHNVSRRHLSRTGLYWLQKVLQDEF